jgi:hypothetical protein
MARKPNARVVHNKPAVPIRLADGPTGPAPVVLTGERLKLWNDIRQRWQLEGPSEALLRNAVEALERAAALAEQVSVNGAVFVDRFGGIRANPAAMLERDFRGLAARSLQALSARLEG